MAAVATTTANYISTIDFIQKPEISDALYQRFFRHNSFWMMDMEMLGFKEVTKQVDYHWHEENRILQGITTTGSVGSPGAGNNIVLTLSAADHENGGRISYPLLNQIVEFPNRVKGVIVAKNTATAGAHTITVKPLKASTNIGAIAAGTRIIFTGNAHGEGTGQPAGRTPIPTKYMNNTQIFKNSYVVTGTAQSTVSWMELTDSKDKKYNKWFYQGEREEFTRFMAEMQSALLTSENSDAGLTDGNGELIKTTRGLIPDIRTNGNNFPAASFTMTSWDNIIKRLNNQSGATSNFIYLGDSLHLTMSNLITAQMKNDEINYDVLASAGMNGKERAATFGFDSVRKAGYTFHLKTFLPFSDPNLFGATGYGYNNSGFLIPADEVSYYNSSMGKEKGKCLVIKHLEGREYKHWLTGSNSPNQTDDVDVLRFHYRAEKGLMARGLNRFCLIED